VLGAAKNAPIERDDTKTDADATASARTTGTRAKVSGEGGASETAQDDTVRGRRLRF